MIRLVPLFALLAGPALADEMFQPPEGCQLMMTVQERSCSVAQHYICAANPGDQWVAYFDVNGPSWLSRNDKETRWLESTSVDSGVTDRLEPGAAKDASLSRLLATGRDDFDFWTRSDNGERMRYVGFDELTGETVTIDGQTLDRTRFKLETFSANGDLLITREGQQFVSRDHGRFYGGPETDSDWTGATEAYDNSPVRFIKPGDLGFGSTTPQFGCEAQMVLRPLPHPDFARHAARPDISATSADQERV